MNRVVFRVRGTVSDAYMDALRAVGVRPAVLQQDGRILYRGETTDALPKIPVPTCVVVRCFDAEIVERLLLKVDLVLLYENGEDALPEPYVVGREVFNLAFRSIYNGGPKRWTEGEAVKDWERQCACLDRWGLREGRVLVPLAGDVAFVAHAQAKEAVAVEWSDVALAKLRSRFPGGVERENVRLVEAEWYTWAAAYDGPRFTHVFDKDAFGFQAPAARAKYVSSIARLLAEGAIVYLEVKERQKNKEMGPPFHIGVREIEGAWIGFKIVEKVGVILEYAHEGYLQMGYVLKKET
jgi:hypothetical protein